MLQRFLLYPAEALALLAVAVALLRLPFARPLAWLSAAVGVPVFVLFAYVDHTGDQSTGVDLIVFHSAGRAVWAGDDPYAAPGFLNPPTSLPGYALLALLPFDALRVAWAAFNVVAYLALLGLARRVLTALTPDTPAAPPHLIAALTAAVVLSYTARFGVILGQLSAAIALLLLLALWLEASGRPWLAGLPLALATAKPGTLLPFLLLFGWRSWLGLAAGCAVLCLLATPPLSLVERCCECLANIRERGKPGGFDDYAFTNESHAGIVSLDHAFYSAGLRDRRLISGLQLASLAALGLWLAWLMRAGLSRAAAASLVACYSCVFLYHRFHDFIVLMIPLAYAAGRAMEERRAARWLYAACVVALLAALYIRVGWLKQLAETVGDDLVGRLTAVVVLPYVTWLILGVMFALAAAERLRASAALVAAPAGGYAPADPPGPGRRGV